MAQDVKRRENGSKIRREEQNSCQKWACHRNGPVCSGPVYRRLDLITPRVSAVRPLVAGMPHSPARSLARKSNRHNMYTSTIFSYTPFPIPRLGWTLFSGENRTIRPHFRLDFPSLLHPLLQALECSLSPAYKEGGLRVKCERRGEEEVG